jgi:outer membrane immunogenic protein
MKKSMLATLTLGALIVSGPALATDLPAKMPYKASPPPPVEYFSWTGCYIGGHVGGAWGHKSFDNTVVFERVLGTVTDRDGVDFSGWLGGGQGGCQWQLTNVVLGIEGDGSWTNLQSTANDPVIFRNFSAKIDAIYDVTGRLGWAWDRWLIYAKGGGAWAEIAVSNPFSSNNNLTRDGWVIGGGIEWAFLENWSAKLEYLHYDFGGRTFAFNGVLATVPFNFSSNVQQTVDTIKFGINWRFYPWAASPSPVVARY